MFVTGSYRELINILSYSLEREIDFLVFLKNGDAYGITIKSKPFYFKTELKIGKDVILNRYEFEQLKINLEVARGAYDDKSIQKLLTLYTGEVITLTPTGVTFDMHLEYSSAFNVSSRRPNDDMVEVLKKFATPEYSIDTVTPYYIKIPSMTVTPIRRGLKKVVKKKKLDIVFTQEPLVIKNKGSTKLHIRHVATNDKVYEFKTFEVSTKKVVNIEYELTINFFEQIAHLIRTTQAKTVAIGKEKPYLYFIELFGEEDVLLFRGTLNNPLVEKPVISKVTEE